MIFEESRGKKRRVRNTHLEQDEPHPNPLLSLPVGVPRQREKRRVKNTRLKQDEPHPDPLLRKEREQSPLLFKEGI